MEGGRRVTAPIPPLFVSFGDETARGTLFEGQTMLPLTTHCRESSSYEQYVLKEYLAYRIYNLLTDKSLRVRLARVSYRDTSRDRVVERYAFFTEHFQSLAARQNAEVYEPETFDRLAADPLELGTLDLFEFLIGNTDWSASKAHNIVHIRARDGLVTAVPYDFDFSGLVDADYAGPPPTLPIRTVTQRLFRGFCRPDFDWHAVYGTFRIRHRAITDARRADAGAHGGAAAQGERLRREFLRASRLAETRRHREGLSCRGDRVARALELIGLHLRELHAGQRWLERDSGNEHR